MADGTKIEWADATLNYANGCSVISPGCTNCYAMKLAGTRMRSHPSRAGLTQASKAGPVWTGGVRMHEPALQKALTWRRGRKIFWNAHGDLFHENVTDEQIDRLLAVCGDTPQHTHMILTKRSARMREYLIKRAAEKPIMVPIGNGLLAQHPFNNELKSPANVWLGVSVEDQQRAIERVPDLLAAPAAVRFISAEPLLGPVDLTEVSDASTALDPECWGDCNCDGLYGYDAGCRRNGGDGSLERKIDWVIVGGESGSKARPMHPDWARSLRDQCQAAGVPFLFKQWGEWIGVDNGDGCHGTIEVDPDGGPGRAFWDACRSPALITPDACVYDLESLPDDTVARLVDRVGKKAAGRMLDGREWSEFPA